MTTGQITINSAGKVVVDNINPGVIVTATGGRSTEHTRSSVPQEASQNCTPAPLFEEGNRYIVLSADKQHYTELEMEDARHKLKDELEFYGLKFRAALGCWEGERELAFIVTVRDTAEIELVQYLAMDILQQNTYIRVTDQLECFLYQDDNSTLPPYIEYMGTMTPNECPTESDYDDNWTFDYGTDTLWKVLEDTHVQLDTTEV